MAAVASGPKRHAPRSRSSEEFEELVSEWHHGWKVESPGPPVSGVPLRRYQFGDLEVVHCDASRCSGRRTRRAVDEHDDGLVALLMVSHGVERVLVNDRVVEVNPGESLLWDTRSEGRFAADDGVSKATIFMPRTYLAAWTPHLDTVLDSGPLPAARTLALRAVTRALDTAPEATLSAQSGTAVGSAIRELLFAAVGSGDLLVTRRPTERRWRAAVDFVEERLPSSTTAEQLADHLALSVRAVYQLFADRGTTVRGHVRERRLVRARADLIRVPEEPMADIARRWGFFDQSAFTKAFRHAFGETPGACRKRQR